MFAKILGSGQLGKLASLVSPAFFDVMPARQLWSKARQLHSASRDGEAFRRAVAARSEALRVELPHIELVTVGPIDDDKTVQASRTTMTAASNAVRGTQIVALYFHQLFSDQPTLLDLRARAFETRGSRLLWQPATWLTSWSPDFIAALRDMYRGFYTHDNAVFRRGLAALSLSHSEDLFRQQFGAEQHEMLFRTRDFVRIFHAVFERCKAAGTPLHPDFLPLGIYLAALYDHLEELAVAIDVTAGFERATNLSSPQEAMHA
jgi:hypothetical protein